jgi:O-methyltransferase/aklanonic acid methyltransferase
MQHQITEVYEDVAGSYDTFGVPFFGTIGDRLVLEAGIKGGYQVLDAGCGGGAVTIPAARAARDGHVTAIDISQRMLSRTAAIASRCGLWNVAVTRADAHCPPFPPATFDAVLSSMVMFLLDDPAAAARAWRNVLRPGGVAAFTWIVAEDPRWVPVIDAVDAMVPIGRPGFEGLWHHPPFTGLTDVTAMLASAGYGELTTAAVTIPRVYTGPRQWWASSWSQAPRIAWQGIPEEIRGIARDEAFRLLDGVRESDGSLTRNTTIGFTTGHG